MSNESIHMVALQTFPDGNGVGNIRGKENTTYYILDYQGNFIGTTTNIYNLPDSIWRNRNADQVGELWSIASLDKIRALYTFYGFDKNLESYYLWFETAKRDTVNKFSITKLGNEEEYREIDQGHI